MRLDKHHDASPVNPFTLGTDNDPQQDTGAGEVAFEPLITRSSPYKLGSRRPVDVNWRYAYIAWTTLVFLGGFICMSATNPEYLTHSSHEYLSSSSNCPVVSGRLLLEASTQGRTLHRDTLGWALGTLAMSVSLGWAFVWMSRTHAASAVHVVAVSPMVTCLVVALLYVRGGMALGAIFCLGFAACLLMMYLGLRKDLPLCAQIFALASDGLVANPWLVLFLGALWSVWVVLLMPAGAFWVAGVGVGHVRRADIMLSPPRGVAARVEADACLLDDYPVECCVWDTNGWASWYLWTLALWAVWSALLLLQLRTFVVAGTLAQWYFAPMHSEATVDNMLRSIRHAIGPQFGTSVVGASVLVVAEQLRDVSRPDEDGSGASACCGLCGGAVAAFLDACTRYATVLSAITGDPFVESGKQVGAMLRRHFLDTVRMWVFPGVMINMTAVCFSLLWAVLVLLVQAARHKPTAAALSASCFFMSFVVLKLFGSLVLTVADAAYVCYALDRDAGTTSRPAVHRAMDALPLQRGGQLVETGQGAGQTVATARAAAEFDSELSYLPPHMDSLDRLEPLGDSSATASQLPASPVPPSPSRAPLHTLTPEPSDSGAAHSALAHTAGAPPLDAPENKV